MLNRLLLLTCELPPQPGGIGTYTDQIARQMYARGLDVLVLATCGGASVQDAVEHDTTKPYCVKRYPKRAFRPLALANRFLVAMEECRRFKPDLVLVCDYGSTHIARVLSARFGVDYVVMGHGSEFLWQKRTFGRRAYVRSLRKARGHLANSRFTQGLMGDFMGSPEPDIRIVPLGADSGVFRPTGTDRADRLRQEYGLSADATVVLTVGRLSERKGQDLAIRAVARLATKYHALHYVIVGQGPSRDVLVQLAKDLGVEDRIHFAGFVESAELPAHYELADLFVLPSRTTGNGEVEGFGIVISEANLMGLPAVGTSGSGIEDAIVDRVTGLLVEPDSVDAIEAGIEALVSDVSYCHRMGETAREHALANHTWQQTGEKTLEYLKACA